MAIFEEAPDNIEDWMRLVEKKLRTLDRHRHPLVAGDWTIREAANGNLIATHRNGTEVVLASP